MTLIISIMMTLIFYDDFDNVNDFDDNLYVLTFIISIMMTLIFYDDFWS